MKFILHSCLALLFLLTALRAQDQGFTTTFDYSLRESQKFTPTNTDLGNQVADYTGGLVELVSSQTEHIKNFKRVSEDCQRYEDAYRACLEAISDNDYSEGTIFECVGPDFAYVTNDIEFERRKLLSRGDTRLREEMIENCYKIAGLDTTMSNACDLLERDVLDLLWKEFNFHILVDYNKHKYLFEYAKMPKSVFDKLVSIFQIVYKELDELINETNNHRDLTIVRLKSFIDDKTKSIMAKAAQRADHPLPRIRKQVIEIEERITDPNSFNLEQLPRPVVQDTSPSMYVTSNNRYLDDVRQKKPHLLTKKSGLEPYAGAKIYSGNSAGSIYMNSDRHLQDTPKPAKIIT